MSPDAVPAGVIDASGVWKRFRGDRRPRAILEGLSGLRRRRGWRWALCDIDLHVEPGESVGLIGSNGSGKSTLLKILTQVMDPYAGQVHVGGQIGALIEIQAGLHPNLTGRENIYLYGAFLGLSRKEVEARFDEIVEFAELDAAIDRQSKFFSTGMRMRLGFAVAALLDPDVLLVDEVLAVGDASFQQRCLDRLEQAIDAGTTLVFVSHDLSAVEAITRRTVWLEDGRIRLDGPTADVLAAYRQSLEHRARVRAVTDGPVRVTDVSVGRPGGGVATTGRPVEVHLSLHTDLERTLALYLGLSEGSATPVFTVSRELTLHAGSTEVTVVLRDVPVPDGDYSLWLAAHGRGRSEGELVAWQPVVDFEVNGPALDVPPPGVARTAPVHVAATWSTGGPEPVASEVRPPATTAADE